MVYYYFYYDLAMIWSFALFPVSLYLYLKTLSM